MNLGGLPSLWSLEKLGGTGEEEEKGMGFQHDCPLSLCILLGVQKGYIHIFLPGWNKGTFVDVGRWSTFYLPIYKLNL